MNAKPTFPLGCGSRQNRSSPRILRNGCRGQNTLEFALILALLALLGFAFLSSFAIELRQIYGVLATALSAPPGTPSNEEPGTEPGDPNGPGAPGQGGGNRSGGGDGTNPGGGGNQGGTSNPGQGHGQPGDSGGNRSGGGDGTNPGGGGNASGTGNPGQGRGAGGR